jgi:integrase
LPLTLRVAAHNDPSARARQAQAADLPAIRLHDLRRVSASLALEARIHPKVVSERLGHSTVQPSLDRYSHVAEGIHDAAAVQPGAVIFGPCL